MKAFGALCVTGLSLFVLFYNYYLIQPHLSAIFWALCAALVLRQVKKPVKEFLDYLYSINFKLKILIQLMTFGQYLYSVGSLILRWNSLQVGDRFLYISFYVVILAVILLPILLPTDTFATLISIIGCLGFSIFVVLMAVRTCYFESVVTKDIVTELIGKNREYLVEFSNRFTKSEVHPYYYPGEGLSSIHGAEYCQTPNFGIVFRTPVHNSDKDVWTKMENYCSMITKITGQQYRYLKKIQKMVSTSEASRIERDQVEQIVSNFCGSQVQYLKENISELMMKIANGLSANIGWFSTGLSNFLMSSLNVLTGFTEFLFSIFIFFMFLFYFVKVRVLLYSIKYY
jgi:hypothetical protein